MRIARSCLRNHLQNDFDVSPVVVLARLERLIHLSEIQGWCVDIPLPFPDINPTSSSRGLNSSHISLRKYPKGPNFGDDYLIFVNEKSPSQTFVIKLYSGAGLSFYNLIFLSL